MSTPTRPLKGVRYSDEALRDLLARLPEAPFRYRVLVHAVATSGIAEGRGIPKVIANSLRTSLIARGWLRTRRVDDAILLQKVTR
jgi:hypothetical protein